MTLVSLTNFSDATTVITDSNTRKSIHHIFLQFLLLLLIIIVNDNFRYCSNFYGEVSEIEECDWCQSKGKNSIGSKKPAGRVAINGGDSSECSGEKILKQHRDEKKKSSLASPRQATRRYKLLKDVMC